MTTRASNANGGFLLSFNVVCFFWSIFAGSKAFEVHTLGHSYKESPLKGVGVSILKL